MKYAPQYAAQSSAAVDPAEELLVFRDGESYGERVPVSAVVSSVTPSTIGAVPMSGVSAVVGNVIDTARHQNTASVQALGNKTYTFSRTPSEGAEFELWLTNAGLSQQTITIPSSYSVKSQSTVTSFAIPSNNVFHIKWRYRSGVYFLESIHV